MGTKLFPGKFDCYENALPDEPMFVLLARDPDFKRIVLEWVSKRMDDIAKELRPSEDIEMVQEAIACAHAAEEWRKINNGKWRK